MIRFIRDIGWLCCHDDNSSENYHDATVRIEVEGAEWGGWASCDDESHVADVVALAMREAAPEFV